MKPILFNTDMVRAILDNRKTVTRRLVKQSTVDKMVLSKDGKILGSFNACHPEWDVYPTVDDAPYRPGDILYVRETWRVQSARRFDADVRIEFKAGKGMTRIQFPGGGSQYHSRREYDTFVGRWADDRWHPSIHMPREAARIFLRVTDVRAERLQDMLPCDIQRKGCPYIYSGFDEEQAPDWYGWMKNVWDSTIKPKDRALYGWDSNPWVWVIEFERISREEAQP